MLPQVRGYLNKGANQIIGQINKTDRRLYSWMLKPLGAKFELKDKENKEEKK
jgi:hypothetical protein